MNNIDAMMIVTTIIGIVATSVTIFALYKLGTPNSPKGLRYRAARLIRMGVPMDSPSVTVLLKQALIKEHRDMEIPAPDVWEKMTKWEIKSWTKKQLEVETT